MGMYTELVLKITLNETIPEEVKTVLEYMFSNMHSDEDMNYTGVTPQHEFFTKPRWYSIGKCSSYYHHPKAISNINYDNKGNIDYIFSRSDIKNYYGEIESFIDWILPHVDSPAGMCIGYSWYEEDNLPTLIIVPEEKANG